MKTTIVRLLFIITAAMLLIGLFSCTAERSEVAAPPHFNFQQYHTPTIEKDTHRPPEGFSLAKRVPNHELRLASLMARKIGQGKGKGGGKPGGDTTVYQPPTTPTTYNGVILLDFDGYSYPGGYWTTARQFAYSGMSETEIALTVANVQRDYASFNVLVTTDSLEFYKYAVTKRIRIVITESWEWYGQAGGVAYINSFEWAVDEPAFVFSSLLRYNGKTIGDAASHEGGHTFGLRHQCDWDNGVKLNDYSQGLDPVNIPNRAPIAGVSYYDADGGEWLGSQVWTLNTRQVLNSFGVHQNDQSIIAGKVGYR